MNLRLRAFASRFLLLASCFASACTLFDNTQLEQQRAELARLREEAETLRQEAEALRQQGQKEAQEREACNRAFYAFDAGRKAGDTEAAVARYKEGLALCPNDDVAHNELGEIYMRMGRRAEAAAEFQAALQINPNFSRAQKNLDMVR
ncbi:MAG TPA: tetratricopeptide repeat protein [Methylomirabilota bacterium]|jgi:tetratricopeptide (TPR) repeat protein|nr:tetratricopeptide repeat protein [Methylomirabilota bacterium]